MARDPVSVCLAAYDAGEKPAREVEKAAVKAALSAFMAAAPGGAVEVRIPPYAVGQAVEGTRHRRGTPPAVVETDAATFLGLCAGTVRWQEALADGRLRASGERSDLSPFLPLDRPA